MKNHLTASGAASYGANVPLTNTRPVPELEEIFAALNSINGNLAELTGRAEAAVMRIAGAWPLAASDTVFAADRDGIAPAMAAVIGCIHETMMRLEEAVSRAEKL